ncbi:MAG: reactive intermediate/imine deaminase [Candidatus Campbellbacteria bacterium]
MSQPVVDLNSLPFRPSRSTGTGRTHFFSGQVGLKEGKLVEGGLEAELRQALENIKQLLDELKISRSQVCDVTVFLVDMNDYARMNHVYAEFFEGHYKPARTCVAVAALPLGARIELKVVASS